MPAHKNAADQSLARTEDGHVKRVSVRARRLVTPREQLLLIWDLISPQGQEAVMAAARQAGRAEGLDLACGMAIVVPFKISFMQPTQHDVHALERGIAEEMTRRGPELRTGKN
jgi:hypothetical protein